MKKLTFIIVAFAMLCLAATSRAQTPQAIKYQAIARNSSGDVIANQNVSFRISILQGNAQGSIVYEEIQTATTNQFGLANLSIGQGSVVSGVFDSVKWGNDTYFAKIEFDPAGGSNFAVMGTSQLLSVPYSLYSAHAKVADNMPVFPLKAALQATNLQAPFDEPETGLLVYNTDSAGASPYNVIPGYYYNAGTASDPNWVLLSTEGKNTLHALPPCSSNQFGTCAGPGTALGGGNTGYGTSALGEVVLSGSDNTAVGNAALISDGIGLNNTAVGSSALYSNGTGSGNTACGYFALVANFGASQNTAIGDSVFSNNNYGVGLTGIGYGAGASSTTASSVTAIGYKALLNNTADANTAVGDSALYSNTTAANNVAVGYQALAANTTMQDNVAVGAYALESQSYNNPGGLGTVNTAVGVYALAANQPTSSNNGAANTAIGGYALLNNTTGYENTACGALALSRFFVGGNITGMSNTATGYSALLFNTSASSNTADGTYALFVNNGDANTAIGDSALASNTTGNYNTALGYQADVAGTGGVSNATAIGYNAKVAISNALVLGNGESVGIGTSSPSALLHLDNGHIRSQQTTAPTITVTVANGIAAASLSSSSTDVKGTITTVGTNSGGNTELTITFNNPGPGTFTVSPVVVITAASATGQTCTYYVTSSTTVFNLFFAGGGSAPSFNYFVIE